MKPVAFAYSRAETAAQAVDLLRAHGPNAKILAGGQTLMQLLNLRTIRPEHVIDISRVGELRGTKAGLDDVWIGAATTYRELALAAPWHEGLELLAEGASLVGTRAIQNRGTIGGSVANADPRAEVPLCALMLDAVIEVEGPTGNREIAAQDFFLGPGRTALHPDELLTGIRIARQLPKTGWSFAEFSIRSRDLPIVAAAAIVRLEDDGRVAEAQAGLAGVHGTPIRVPGLQPRLAGQRPDHSSWAAAVDDAMNEITLIDDELSSAEYRRDLSVELLTRTLRAAASRSTPR